MQISVESNIRDILPKLAAFTSKQAPFAIAKALTATAKAVQSDLTDAMPTAFDRPTAWTRRAFAIQKADKQNLTAWVFAKDSQARYLKFQVQGGGRRVKGFERRVASTTNADEQAHTQRMVPTRNVKLDAYGGVSLATIRRITAQADTGKGKRYFVGKPRGAGQNAGRGYGIYERTGKGSKLRLLMAFSEPKAYRKRLDMGGIAAKTVQARFEAELRSAVEYAMRTAR